VRAADLMLTSMLWLAVTATAGAADAVFVLGTDVPGRQSFYAVAAEYHRRSAPQAMLVTSLRSLAEVREYLVRHRGDEAWDEVTLVVHGAPWVGLHVPVFVGGAEATLDRVQQAAADGTFPPLPRGVFDASTRLRLESCGMGRRPDFLSALAGLFSDEDGRKLMVSSSDQFVAYRRRASSVVRDELPFVFDVLPIRDGKMDRKIHRRLRGELAALGVEPGQAAELEVLPINLVLQMPPVPGGGRPPLRRLLAADPALARRLHDHGLRLDQLDWRPVESGGAVVRAEGSATLFLLRAGLGASSPGVLP
jgi:hypothetical protein